MMDVVHELISLQLIVGHDIFKIEHLGVMCNVTF